MHNRRVTAILRSIHILIFALVLVRDWANRAAALLWRAIGAAARALGIVSTTNPAQQRRGKQSAAPRVLAVVLADADRRSVPLAKLADVLAWCMRCDIRTLFVYHPEGLEESQRQQLSALLSRSGCDAAVQTGFRGAESRQIDGVAASQRHDGSSPAATVRLLCGDDARWPLMEAARLGSAAASHSAAHAASAASPAAELHRQLAEAAGPAAILEPDIVLVCGDAFTLAGFPPWMLRFSEIYHLGHLADVTASRLEHTLRKYRNVTQRFGA